MSVALRKMLLEGIRLAVFAAASVIVTYLLNVVFPSLEQTQTVAVLTLVLRMADKYVHANEEIKANGLVPF